MSATRTNAAAVCLDMGMAQLDETIQQSWAGMSAQERGNCSGAYSAWNTLKLAYDATAVVSLAKGSIAGIKSLTGVLRLNRSFSRFVIDGKVIYNAVKSRTLSAPMGRMGARMERYVEWGRLSGAGDVVRGISKSKFKTALGTTEELAEQAWALFKDKDWKSLEKLFVVNNINVKWPPNNGFVEYVETTLAVNMEIDRYGGKIVNGQFSDEFGDFVSPAGASFESRALPESYRSGPNPKPYRKYRVIKEIPGVKEGPAIL